LTVTLESALARRRLNDGKRVWYKSQKEHWRGWLLEYDGPGAYGRKTWNGRSAEYVYNHINCAPMVLWLGDACGVSRSKMKAAVRAAPKAGSNSSAQCAAIRREVPWTLIEECLS